ncbi:hypothetical protein [Hymenobacter nivis]|uniref:Uncharacterized protein n=1 Tax=Hymenobacter nivis TaxID=1850093 RepID=A0A502GDA6_9BACT|nr:hypothetical protein [Hymenobacter nivis]TPG59488.1 hypothetical protein EAH73_21490 [Hymenobacter nivis]
MPSAERSVPGPFRPPLSAPLISEQTHELLRYQLAQALVPLAAYCAAQEAREDLSDWQAERVAELRYALSTLRRYDGHVEDLLPRYRTALATAHQALADRRPALTDALQPDWEVIAARLLSRLARHEARPGPTPLAARLAAWLRQPHWRTRATQPPDHRQALAAITSSHLLPQGPERL